MYLMCILEDKHDYTAVSDEQQTKLTRLLRDKKLPPTFNLGGKEIVTSTILGFTESPLSSEYPKEAAKPKFRDWSEFRQWAVQQEWYRKKRLVESVEEKPPQIQAVKLDLAFLDAKEQSQ